MWIILPKSAFGTITRLGFRVSKAGRKIQVVSYIPWGSVAFWNILGEGKPICFFLVTLTTPFSPNTGNPRDMGWADMPIPGLSALRSPSCPSPVWLHVIGNLMLKSDPSSHANWLVAECGQWEVLAGSQKLDRKEKPGCFFSSQPWATALALVIFPSWLLWRLKSLYSLREPLKEKEYKIRSRVLEEAQEGKDPSNISLTSFLVNPPLPRF